MDVKQDRFQKDDGHAIVEITDMILEGVTKILDWFKLFYDTIFDQIIITFSSALLHIGRNFLSRNVLIKQRYVNSLYQCRLFHPNIYTVCSTEQQDFYWLPSHCVTFPILRGLRRILLVKLKILLTLFSSRTNKCHWQNIFN